MNKERRETYDEITLVLNGLYLKDLQKVAKTTSGAHQHVVEALASNPNAGVVIPGSGGWRKLRLGSPRQGQGKRGALRLVHLHLRVANENHLLRLYAKREQTNLSQHFIKQMRQAAETIKKNLNLTSSEKP